MYTHTVRLMRARSLAKRKFFFDCYIWLDGLRFDTSTPGLCVCLYRCDGHINSNRRNGKVSIVSVKSKWDEMGQMRQVPNIGKIKLKKKKCDLLERIQYNKRWKESKTKRKQKSLDIFLSFFLSFSVSTFIDLFTRFSRRQSRPRLIRTLQVIQIRISCEVGTMMTFSGDIIFWFLGKKRKKKKERLYTLSMLIHVLILLWWRDIF